MVRSANQGARLGVVLGKDYAAQDCLIARALEVVGERWTLLIVRDALFGVRRFSDFLVRLDIPKAVLASRLRALVDNGVMRREPDPDRAGREIYELTEAGLDLWPAIYALRTWAARHRAPASVLFAHAPCGTPIDESGACPACDLTPMPQDVVMSRRPGDRGKREDPVSLRLTEERRLLEPVVR